MPDTVTDIVHRITYETNRSAIDDVNKAFDTQFNELKALQAEQAKLNELMAKQGNSATVVQQLNQKLAENKQRIDQVTESVGRQYVANERLQSSVKKVASGYNGLGMAVSQISRELPAFAFSAQTGLLAISNNIPILLDQLKSARAAGQSTSEIFKAIGSSLFGLTGIITLAVTALTLFGDKIFSAGKEAKAAEEDFNNFAKAIDNVITSSQRNINEQTNRISTLFGIIEKGGTQAVLAAEQLQDEFPRIFKQYSVEQILQGKGIENLKNQVVARERSNQASKIALEIQSRLPKLQDDVNKAVEENNIAQARLNRLQERYNSLSGEAADRALPALENAREKAAKAGYDLNQKQFLLEAANLEISRQQTKSIKEATKATDLYINRLTKAEQEAERLRKEQEKLNKPFDTPQTIGERPEFISPIFPQRPIPTVESETQPTSPRFFDTKATLAEYTKLMQLIANEDARQLKRIQERKEAAIEAEQAIFNAFISFNQAKQDLLDLEYERQSERVRQAEFLAERGNAEELKAEQDKLAAIQSEREKAARQQIQINALLQASNAAVALSEAIGAIVKTASQGDPYTIAFRIAAAVAALVAGIASLKTAFQGFAEGGYTGDGDKNAPAGIVHKGEFVITKERTAQYRPLLEAIHEGKINPMALHQSSAINNSMDTKRLEQGLAEVKDAIEMNRVNVKQVMDMYGLTQSVESYQKKQRKLWQR